MKENPEWICSNSDYPEYNGQPCVCGACVRLDHCEADPDIAPGHCGECTGPVASCDAPDEEIEED